MSLIIENGVLKEYIPTGETEIVIPEGVTSIGNLAFYGTECGNLKSIKLPRSLTVINRCAFDCCRNLQSVEIPDSVTKIEDYAFNACGIRSIVIPNSVTSIGDQAFSWCKNLRSITIPESVTHIGYAAFSDMKITFETNGFQISLFVEWWGLTEDEKNPAIFYNEPTLENFKKIEQNCYKYPLALLRFFGHNDDKYRQYIKKNVIKISKWIIDENEHESFNRILNAGFITKLGIDKLINYSSKKEKTEMTALLLEHKNKHFGFTDINKRFRL